MKRSEFRTSRRSFIKATAGMGLAASLSSRAFGGTDSGNPIVLGIQGDLTGALAHDGLWEQRAVVAAANWHNKRGGIAGRPIKVVSVDTETKTDVGIRRLQQLIQEDACDFVVGSGSGGIGVASVPIAKDASVVYLPLSRTDSITTETANPYLYRFVANSSIAARASQKWMIDKIGKKWSIVLSDIAFGHSQRDAFTAALQSVGGEVVQSIALPPNVSDPLPFLLKLDRSVDGILTALWGPDSVRVYPALVTVGVGAKPKFAVSSTTNLFDVLKMGKSVDGLYAFDEVPWELSDYPNADATRTAFTEIGIGPTGRSVEGDDYVMLPSAVSCWECVSFMKRAIEGSGWASRADGIKLSNWTVANPAMPTGEMFLRPNLTVRSADQQAFADVYILQVQSGHMRVVNKIAAGDTMYSPTAAMTR
ncbi:ABC transporter substrate-binding protein [Bradyrhizobium canariense]|uniref:Amino acid/amide ABC transporter substrate-binding protein, HAAT family n=1 Tax=Bradyrhizobium canariense TaxID=255045 RepID=A0A1H1VFV4_9BRAD|nr:ABC transporter substrate-binding protein [Bradyrhizobium canariense]SDS83613.1 amino acid/amide ABC transporter substrate-binding protein, HAAT family [Bradyrhizobium canariense]